MEKLLLRPTEAAELIGIGRSHVYALIKDGTLPSVKLGKSLRVPTDRLRQWVERQEADQTVGS